ncbi:MAG: hypothetical protein ACOYN0_13635, partial [Phycisphaerales bacterium]
MSKLSLTIAMASVAGLACSMANAQVIISEVVDGPLGGGNPKMLELTNVGTTPVSLGAGDVIGIYSNGVATRTVLVNFATASPTSPGPITIAPGQSWT